MIFSLVGLRIKRKAFVGVERRKRAAVSDKTN